MSPACHWRGTQAPESPLARESKGKARLDSRFRGNLKNGDGPGFSLSRE